MGWFFDSRQDPWIDQFFHFQPSNDVGRTGSWLPLKMVDITEQSIAKAGMSDVKQKDCKHNAMNTRSHKFLFPYVFFWAYLALW